MKLYRRLVTSLLIIAVTLGFLPPFSPGLPAQAASSWVKDTGRVNIGSERFPLDAWVIKEDGTYRMWYTHVTTNLTDTEILNTIKGLNLDSIVSAIAATDLAGLFDAKGDLASSVPAIRHLLNNITTTIGYATSTDGKTWTVQKSEALAGSSSPLWLRDPVGAPTVINDGGTYKMWYTALTTNLTEARLQSILTDLGDPSTRKQALLDFLDSTATVIGYATSPDGSNWTVQNPRALAGSASALWARDSVGAPSVIKDGTTYKMWYTRLRTDLTQADLDSILASIGTFNADALLGVLDGTSTVIGYATSSDGSDWTVQNPQAFSGGGALWQSIADPTVIKNGTVYEMWYTGVKKDLVASGFKSLLTEFRKLPISSLWNTVKTRGVLQAVTELAAVNLSAIKTLLGNSATVIGYAASSDGVSWVVQDPQNLAGATGALWSSVSSPSVIKVAERYDMWFTRGIDDLTWQKTLERLLGLDLSIGYASVAPKVLQSIDVTPASASIAMGRTQQFQAIGRYSDNSTDNLTAAIGILWASTNTTVVTINPATGLATSIAIGSAIITATFGGVTSNMAVLTVTVPELDSIAVTPANPSVPKGVPVQFTAIGTNSDSSTTNITASVVWASSNTTVASISASGLASTLAPGAATITASLGGKSGSTILTVTPPAFVAMVIAPANPMAALGDTVNFTATDYLTDNSTIDRTAAALWTSANTTVAVIGPGGVALTKATGVTLITATYLTHSANTTLTVGPKALRRIDVTPTSASIAVGRTQQFQAIGRYSDNSTDNLTAAPGITWASMNPTTATINPATGLALALSPGTSNITATFGGVTSNMAVLTVTPKELDLITLSPVNPAVPTGVPVPFTAMGTYSDNSTDNITASVAWTSSNTTVATIAPSGVANTLALGSTTITASLGGKSASTTLTVTAATLQSIAIAPLNPSIPLGLTQQFSASGTYSDNSTFDITIAVTWASSNTSVATIAAGGLATSRATGTTDITASLNGKSASTTLTVLPPVVVSLAIAPVNPTIVVSASLQFIATEYYTDNSSVNVTALAAWTSANTTVATIGPSTGMATGVAPGTTNITATYAGRSESTVLTVVPQLTLEITPVSASIAMGRTQQFQAIGHFFGGSTQNLTALATWTSSNPAKATISATGLATSIAIGSAIITATYAGVSSNDAVLTVTAPELDSIAVTPASPSIALGTTVPFSALGTYSNGTTQNLTAVATWTSNNTAVATISSTGLATGRGTGTALITASYAGKSGTATLTVTSSTVVALVVTPANPSLAAGDNVTFAATEYYTDGSSIDRTASATWSTSNPAVAAILTGSTVKALTVGSTNITATFDGRTGTSTLTVTPARLAALTISPPSASIAAGRSVQLTLTGRYSDDTTRDLSADAGTIWASLNPAVATVNASGSVKGITPGTTTIRATNTGERAEITVTVTESVLEYIAVTPMHITVPTGISVRFTATGVYSDTLTQDLTASVTWSSNNTAIATIGAGGMANTLSTGNVTITATFGSFSGLAFVEVTAAALNAISVSPSSASVPAGRTQQFTAWGTFSDNTSADITSAVTWTSSNTAIATVSTGGLATSEGAGTATITATLAGKSGSATLTVSAPVPDTITVSPPGPSLAKGRTLQMRAIATMSNKTVQDITSVVTWSSSNSSILSITAGGVGVVKGMATGTATVTATGGTASGSTTVTVTPAELDIITITPASAVVAAGRSQQFIATGNFSDSTSADITALAIWTSSNSAVASVSATGNATSFTPGLATITATRSGRSASANLTVTQAVIDGVSVTPANRTISAGMQQQFRAFAVYSNGTNTDVTTGAAWSSTNTAVASINATTGLATGSASGNTTIGVTFDGATGSTTLIVTNATLSSLAVKPSTPDIPAGRTQQFTAEGTFTDSAKVDMTDSVNWTSTDVTIAKVNALGLAASFVPGTVNITASWGSIVSPAARLRVQAPELDGVTISPANPAITFVAGNPPALQFRATRVDSDGTTSDATATVTWSSSNTGVATIAAGGLATTVAAGSTNITATLGSQTYTTTLTVLADTVPPRVTLVSPVAGQVLGSNTLTVSGRVDDRSATVTVIVNGTTSALALDGEGNFSKGVLLNTGSNTVLVMAADGSGNAGSSGTVTVVVDPKKPAITIVTPQDETLTNNPALTVSGNVMGATTVSLVFNGVAQNIAVVGGIFTANVTLTDGVNIIVAQAYAATNPGNPDYLGTSGVRRAILDRAAPVVAIDTPTSDGIVNNALATVSGTVDDPAVTSAQLVLNGIPRAIPVMGGAFSQDVTLSPGANSIQVMASDPAGNTAAATVSVTLDTTKPEVTVTAPRNNLLSKSASQLVTGAVFDPAVTTATILVNRAPQMVSIAPDGTFSKMVALSSGNNTIEVTATDGVNTGSSGVISVIVDTDAPGIVIGLTDPTDSVIITVSTDEPLAAVPSVKVDGADVTMTIADVNRWSGVFGGTPPIAAGDYTVTITATDRAGNTATRQSSFTKKKVTVDGVKPTTVTSPKTKLDVETNGPVSGADISVTRSHANPSGNVGKPEDATHAAGVFLEIVTSPELRDNLKQIYIEVSYDPEALPPGVHESTLKLYLWDTAAGKWKVVPNSGVNTVAHIIFGTIAHLSKYGGFGTTAPPAPPPPAIGAPVVPTGAVSIENITNYAGLFMMPFALASPDAKLSVPIAAGTKVLDKDGRPTVTWLRAVVQTQPAATPAAVKAVSTVYSLGPDGSTFNPAISLTITYDPAKVPAGVDEKNLFIATWNAATSTWDKLPSTVNTAARTITATVSHFSDFAVLASARPATFTVSNLTVSPSEVFGGQDVTISVDVANTGDLSGTYTVNVQVEGEILATKQVTVAGGTSQRVTLTVKRDNVGTYKVLVEKLSGTFTVKAPAIPAKPPAFTPKDLSISPAQVNIKQNVTIAATVTNTGELSGSYKVTLKVNGVSIEEKVVTLAGGASEKVTFTVARDAAGTYSVDVNGLTGTFTVKAAEVPVTPPEKPVTPPVVKPGPNWGLIGGIIAVGAVIIVLLVVLIIRRRPRGA